jgi:putative acetyltransferase
VRSRADDDMKATNGLQIRPERASDIASVHALNREAFETSTEADLVDALRGRAEPIISLVADAAGSIVGHILFSPVTLSGQADLKIMGLALMAVLPAEQRRGIGSALVRAGLERCKQLGFGAVVVLGHPEYYPRFDFVPAARFGIGCEYEVPDEVFMALELEPGILRGKTGTIRYHAVFASL